MLGPFHVVPFHIHSLVFFGFYCVLIGVLIFRSNFLPRILGVFMVIAGFSQPFCPLITTSPAASEKDF